MNRVLARLSWCAVRPHRLQRLKLLTQGAALLGLGSVEACQQQGEPPHINSPYIAPDAGPDGAAAATPAPPPPVEPPHINSPYVPPDAGASTSGAAPTAAIATSEPSAKPERPKLIINAPPKHLNAPNKVSE